MFVRFLSRGKPNLALGRRQRNWLKVQETGRALPLPLLRAQAALLSFLACFWVKNLARRGQWQ